MPMNPYTIGEQWIEIGNAPLAVQVQVGAVKIHAGNVLPDEDTEAYVRAGVRGLLQTFPSEVSFTTEETIYAKLLEPSSIAKIVVVK